MASKPMIFHTNCSNCLSPPQCFVCDIACDGYLFFPILCWHFFFGDIFFPYVYVHGVICDGSLLFPLFYIFACASASNGDIIYLLNVFALDILFKMGTLFFPFHLCFHSWCYSWCFSSSLSHLFLFMVLFSYLSMTPLVPSFTSSMLLFVALLVVILCTLLSFVLLIFPLPFVV
jgi:hypothetical protein